MLQDLEIRCQCGAVRGLAHSASAWAGIRVVCYCDDCQAFANSLATRDLILDDNGGTDIYQMSPARLEFSQGADELACVRVTPKGGYRWYTRCCETAIGNTPPTARVPFVGLIHSCIASSGNSLDDLVGPVRLRIMARFAIGKMQTLDSHPGFSPGHLTLIASRILLWWLRGDQKRSPFFNPATGEPVAVPRALDRH